MYDYEYTDARSELTTMKSSAEDGSLQDLDGREATMEIFKSSFGLLDILFLLAGISTAFKMAREGRSIRSRF
ncbi:hypothetical protein KO507_13015 [Gilvimarinus agarilyticus]|nr:hypothetical protein [Gilvimarinus agarilyticus]